MLPSACPLDCPDACSLEVGVENGRVVAVGGSPRNPVTGRLHLREGPPLRRARVRAGPPAPSRASARAPRARRVPQASAGTKRSTLVAATTARDARARCGGEAILPFSLRRLERLADAGHDRRACSSGGSARRASRERSAPRRREPRRTATVRQDGRRRATRTTSDARLIVLWGVNPSATGIHLVPYDQRERGGGRAARRDRSAAHAARATRGPAPGRPARAPIVAVALARASAAVRSGHADARVPRARTRRASTRLRGAPRPWTARRAPRESAGSRAAISTRLARLVRRGVAGGRSAAAGASSATATAACGRRAVLALPAVAGKFGVRGGGYTMSNSSAWGARRADAGSDAPRAGDARRQHEPARARRSRPATTRRSRCLFVYNCNPVATTPEPGRRCCAASSARTCSPWSSTR